MIRIMLWSPATGYFEPEPTTGLAEETILFLDIPSVYGASKYEQRAAEVPSSVSLVTADEIRIYEYRTLADVLQGVRGFFVTYDRNYSYIGVSEFGQPGTIAPACCYSSTVTAGTITSTTAS